MFRILILAGVAFLMFAYVAYLFKQRNHPEHMKRCALVIFLLGTAMYFLGYWHEPVSEGVFTTLIRSAMSAVKLFLYETDLLEIEHVQEEPYFLDLFFVIYVLAMLTTISAFIMLFGKRLASLFLLKLRKNKHFKHVFIGINGNSVSIAKGLNSKDVVFIEFPEEKKEEHSLEVLLKSLFSTKQNSDFQFDDYLVLRAKRRISTLDTSDNIFGSIGLKKLYEVIDPETVFYILSSDMERNLNLTLSLVSDERIKGHVIHASVQRQGLSIPYKDALKDLRVHFVFPSSLAVVPIMKDASLQPSSVMETVTDEKGRGTGSVKGGFAALFVGFGETGQSALKMAYELSAAVGPDGKPIPCKFYVQDKNMSFIQGRFLTTCPGLIGDNSIVYEDCHCESTDFWKKIHERIDELNYIVIATGDDNKNIDLAGLILSFARKKKKDGVGKLRILVRKTVTTDKQVSLLKSYNDIAKADVVTYFGELDQIFTPELIISESSSGINQGAISSAAMIQTRFIDLVEENGIDWMSSPLIASSQDAALSSKVSRRNLHLFIGSANHAESKKKFAKGWTSSDIPEDVLYKLGRCEHMRISNYLKAHGYSYSPVDDETVKHSSLLVPWETLEENRKVFYILFAKAALD